jgi:hypothetical protein
MQRLGEVASDIDPIWAEDSREFATSCTLGYAKKDDTDN